VSATPFTVSVWPMPTTSINSRGWRVGTGTGCPVPILRRSVNALREDRDRKNGSRMTEGYVPSNVHGLVGALALADDLHTEALAHP